MRFDFAVSILAEASWGLRCAGAFVSVWLLMEFSFQKKGEAFLREARERAERLQQEFVEPAEHFSRLGVRRTIVFFGSSRWGAEGILGSAGRQPATQSKKRAKNSTLEENYYNNFAKAPYIDPSGAEPTNGEIPPKASELKGFNGAKSSQNAFDAASNEAPQPEKQFGSRANVPESADSSGFSAQKQPDESASASGLEASCASDFQRANPLGSASCSAAGAAVDLHLSPYCRETYKKVQALAAGLAGWSKQLPEAERFHICTGAGPGLMEAANRGAHAAGSPSVGMNIELPFEQAVNPFVSAEFQANFKYFMPRKFWLACLARAFVVAPGGLGTLDELFEILTLMQTQKINDSLPVVLLGRDFWTRLVNFELLQDCGLLNPLDLGLFRICDTAEEAQTFITETLKPPPKPAP